MFERLGGGGYAKPRISSPAEFSGADDRLVGVEESATPIPTASAMTAASVARKPFKFPCEVRLARIFTAKAIKIIKNKIFKTTNCPYRVSHKSLMESIRVRELARPEIARIATLTVARFEKRATTF